MTALSLWLLDTTIKGSVLIVLVAAIQWLIGSRVDARWRHLLWVIVLVRLLLPGAPASSWSLFNAIPQRQPVPVVRVITPESVTAADVRATARSVSFTLERAPVTPAVRWLI
ncbi:MAG TPA: hypothetical protein VFT12_05600, partial [Thermoanaerobaculia bacterium]|nr:hypothetical protein [Thermoanaerobaculia bacterium]